MTAPDNDPVRWLAKATAADPAEVVAGLDEGTRRRIFVVDELLDSGYRGGELLGLVERLTGMDDAEARALIAAREAVADRPEMRPRDRRLTENEELFRRANEEIVRQQLHGDVPHTLDVLCECTDRDCRRKLTMPLSEYEWLRQNDRRFVVLPGHEAPAVERVVERFDGFVIVEHDAPV